MTPNPKSGSILEESIARAHLNEINKSLLINTANKYSLRNLGITGTRVVKTRPYVCRYEGTKAGIHAGRLMNFVINTIIINHAMLAMLAARRDGELTGRAAASSSPPPRRRRRRRDFDAGAVLFRHDRSSAESITFSRRIVHRLRLPGHKSSGKS